MEKKGKRILEVKENTDVERNLLSAITKIYKNELFLDNSIMNVFVMKESEFERQPERCNQEVIAARPASRCRPEVALARCLGLLLVGLVHRQTCRALSGGCPGPKGLVRTLG